MNLLNKKQNKNQENHLVKFQIKKSQVNCRLEKLLIQKRLMILQLKKSK